MMGGACDLDGEVRKCIQNFKTSKEVTLGISRGSENSIKIN
jgi:hypothetical protein